MPRVRQPRRGRARNPPTARDARTVGKRRVQLVVAGVVAVGLLLVGRAVHLSIVEDGTYQVLAAEQSVEVASEVQQLRGDIVSADGRDLATSSKTARVIATPYLIESPENAARRLSEALGTSTNQSVSEIEDTLTQRDDSGALGGYSVIAEDVKPKVAAKVQDLNIEGVTALPSSKRVYPDGELASQLTGHVGEYGEAMGGVEARYNKRLKSGENVDVTVDSAVQQQLEDSLESAAKKYHAKSALGLVMRVDDGSIVALANTPGYDNNRFGEASAEAQRNRVLTDPYEPGSTFKAFTLAAALEERAVSRFDKFTVPDSIEVAGHIIHDSLEHKTRTMTPRKILQESSNVGTIKISRRVGGELIDEYIRRFGFGEPTGIDLWGEDAGTVPAYEDWSGVSIGNIPIGQGITVTPLQLVAGYAALANGGRRVTPHVGRQFRSDTPEPRVISQRTSDIVCGMLRGVVEKGTGTHAQIPGYSVAGKTGTSQKVDPEAGTYGSEYVASFVGFAPASDPRFLTLIVVDEPQGVIWGETVAAPAFRQVMRFTLGYFNVPPDLESERTGKRERRKAEGNS